MLQVVNPQPYSTFNPQPKKFLDILCIAPPLFPQGEGGKSGQRRAPCFLTGRGPAGNGRSTESATERETARRKAGKGEKVG